MTREEKIIATAFTGKMFIDGSEMGSLYEYMEKKVGYGVIDIMLASKEFWEELHRACEQDFIDMVSKEQSSLPPNLDEAAQRIAYDVCKQLPNGEEKDGIVYYAILAAIAGAEWMAGQGVIIEGRIAEGHREGYPALCLPTNMDNRYSVFKPGDKVVVQIRKA